MTPATPPHHHRHLDTPPTPRYGPMEDSPVSKRKETKPPATKQKPTQSSISDTKTPNRHRKVVPASVSRMMLTPADTPVSSRRTPVDVLETTKKTGRVLFPPANIVQAGSGRTRHNAHSPVTPRTSSRVRKSTHKHLLRTKPVSQPQFAIFSDAAAAKAEANGDDPFVCPDAPKAASPRAVGSLAHPHHAKPDPSVPGMWYNFRGKKHYRPFKAGEGLDLKPKVLFQEELSKVTTVQETDDPFGGGPIEGSGGASGSGSGDSEAETDEDADPLSSFSEEIASLS
ncbi:hypothetical protein CJU90_2106 [Yarrowia sp. C11]|nr:hypothetical protein CKK34_6134 [Yarrowia sp. E02]KAG5372031.1 hypothetical protein CJU90_2106 [Yarrowia sp. C11]